MRRVQGGVVHPPPPGPELIIRSGPRDFKIFGQIIATFGQRYRDRKVLDGVFYFFWTAPVPTWSSLAQRQNQIKSL